MKRILKLGILLFLLVSIATLWARPIQIKLGSAAPDNSVWADALKRMANEWAEISDGQIQLRIYFAGFKDEADLIRKMKFNQLQAGIVTGFGLQALYPNVLAVSMPFVIQSEDEFEYVLEKMGPEMAEAIDQKGFKLLTWSSAGWVYFFTKEAITYPSDLKKMKIASSGTEASDIMNAMKNLGFHPVSLAAGEVLTGLASGMVDALYATPIAVGAMQWFGVADNMADMKVAPFLGGILINKKVWNQIPEDIKPELMESVQKISKELDQQIGSLENDAIQQMKEYGLKVNEIPPEAVEEWEEVFNEGIRNSGENFYSQDFMRRLQQHIQDYRESNEGEASR